MAAAAHHGIAQRHRHAPQPQCCTGVGFTLCCYKNEIATSGHRGWPERSFLRKTWGGRKLTAGRRRNGATTAALMTLRSAETWLLVPRRTSPSLPFGECRGGRPRPPVFGCSVLSVPVLSVVLSWLRRLEFPKKKALLLQVPASLRRPVAPRGRT